MSEEQYFKQWQQVITEKGIYTVIEQIGEGSFGRVFKVQEQKSQKIFAIKQVPSSKLQEQLIKDAFQKEIEVQKKIDNPNVVKLYEDYYHEPSNSYLLVMRYCQDGDLDKKIKQYGTLMERLTLIYFKQILNGFLGLHQQGIIHRDIRPSNIYLDKGVASIGSFGFVRQIEQIEQSKFQIDTFSYMAPEILLSQPYNYSVDIYSLGVLLYNMLFGEVPFKAPSGNCVDLLDQIKKGDIDFTLKDINISQESQKLIKEMLAYEAKDRITWEKMCQKPQLSGSLFYQAHPQLEETFNTGIMKYAHLRKLYGNLIRILNEINTLKDFLINYEIPAFMTAKKVIQQIKKLLKIIKEKQNIFNIEPFDRFVVTQQYADLSSKCEVDLKQMRESFPQLLEECRESVKQLHLTHSPLLQQLESEETNEEFNYIFYECLTNYAFGLREQCNSEKTESQRNLFYHLIHVSEIIQYESFEKDYFAFDVAQHMNQIRNIPFEKFEMMIDKAFEMIIKQVEVFSCQKYSL